MHGLVQWRARQLGDYDGYWHLYIQFIAAAANSREYHDLRYLVLHLPIPSTLVEYKGWDDEAEATEVRMSIANVWYDSGRWDEAVVLYLQVCATMTTILGAEHPETLTAIFLLAATYLNQGRWKEAEELQVRVMDVRSRVLSEEHPDTLMAMNNLAATYWDQGQLKKAEELQVRVMEARSRVLSEDHPDTLMAMNNLAATYWKQGQWKKVEELQVKLMEAASKVTKLRSD